jgi:hypothetical protein
MPWVPAVIAAVLVLVLGNASFAETVADGRSAFAEPGTSSRLDVRLLDLAAVRQLLNSTRQRMSNDTGEQAGALADFSLLVDAVVGDEVQPLVLDALITAATTADGPRVLATPGVSRRDAVACQLLALGYSARETADVVSGRISRHALDTARKMLATGRARDVAANYLDDQYNRTMARNEPIAPTGQPQREPATGQPQREPAARQPQRAAFSPFDAAIEKYAALYNVGVAFVRAMIMTESRFDQGARSPAGAIGLMQLMPATARALGVDPRIAEQNIEGGVRYFSELLRMFGSTELALVAYNGGPGFARRYGRREAALYGETRDYVNKVLARVAARPTLNAHYLPERLSGVP